jgi:hypothetical protein
MILLLNKKLSPKWTEFGMRVFCVPLFFKRDSGGPDKEHRDKRDSPPTLRFGGTGERGSSSNYSKTKMPRTSRGTSFCSGGGIRTHDLRIMIPTL